MKRLVIVLSIAAASLTRVDGAISVGTTGSGLIDFAARPAATEWSTASSPGNDITIATAAELDLAVQGVIAGTVTAQVVDGAGANPPAQNALAVWSAAAGGPSYLQTRPTGNAGTALMATLRNDTGTDATSLTIAYLLNQSAANPPEQVPAHQVYVSLTGEANSWTSIPALSGGPAGFRSNVVVLPSAWINNTFLYVLWADDNATGGADRGYQIDNVTFAASNADVPLSIALMAPAGNQLLVAPANVPLAAITSGTVPANSVSFYTNGVLFSSHAAPPYSNELVNLAPGNYAIHAVALNATETAYSRTNLVRVRDEFIHYLGGTHLENFNGMGTNNGETPIGWYVGAALPVGAMTTTSGDGSAGAVAAVLGWNYGTAGQVDRALGTAPTGADRNIVAQIQNNTSSNIVSFELRYDGEVWRNYTNDVGRMLTSHVSFDLGSTWIPTTFDFTQPFPPAVPQVAIDGNSPNSRTPDIGGTITPPAPIPPGSVLYLRWHDLNDPNVTDGGLAIDNVRFTASFGRFSSFITITSPSNGATFAEAATVVINATAAMENPITHVSFFNNGVHIGDDTNAPFSLVYSNSLPGTHALTATAHDIQGLSVSVAAPTEITVLPNVPPTVSITSPLEASAHFVGVTVSNISAAATDQDGTIVRVEFYLDGNLWAVDTTSPYSFDLCDITAGAHTIAAKAIDNANGSASHAISLSATNPPGVAVIIPNGAMWNYLDDGSDQGIAWRELQFNDAGWSNGLAELGYGDGPGRPERTIIGFGPNPNAKHPTTYFRKRFSLNNTANMTNVILRLLRDDHAIVYLNGNQVFNDITNAVVDFSTYAPPSAVDDGTVYQTVNLPPTLLVQGANVVAVEVHQDIGTSSDLSFDLMLWAQGGQPGPPVAASQPESQIATLGSTINFTVDVSGTPPFSYQWHLNCRDLLDGTNQILTIQGVGLENIGNYSVTVRNALGQITTWDAALTVTNVPLPQARLSRDKNNLVLRWPRRDVPYRLQALSKIENVGQGQPQPWTDSDWSIELNGQDLLTDVAPEESSKFFRVASPSVRILRQPQGRTVPIGQPITLNVLATGTPPLNYQWRFNGSPLLGETNSFITLDVNRFSYGAYQVAVQDANDALLSSAAVIRPDGIQTVLSDSFGTRTLFTDGNGSIHGLTLGSTREPGEPDHAGLPGGRSVWLAWRAPFSGVVTFDTTGSGFDTLLAAYGPNVNVIAADDDSASNLCSRIRFNVTANTIYDIALDGLAGAGGFFVLNWSMLQVPAGVALPVITQQPVDRIIASNEVTTFSVGATDISGANLTYQWFQNGIPVPEVLGGTSPTLRVGGQPPSAPAEVGQLYVEVSNSAFTVRSRFASLQFSSDPQLRFVSKLLVDSICGFTPYDPSKNLSKCCGATAEEHGDHPKTTTKLLSAAAGSLTGSLTYGGTVPPVGSRAYWTWVTNGWDCLKLVSLSATVKVGSTHQPCTLVLIDSTTGLLVKAADNGLSPNLSNINKAKAGKIYWIALGFDNPSAVGTLNYSFTGTCP